MEGIGPARAALPNCPHCTQEILTTDSSQNERVCTFCGKPFESFSFTPVSRVDLAKSTMPLGLAEAGPSGATPCARHAGNAATASCERCGVFVCGLCRIDLGSRLLCPACFERLETGGELVEVKNRFFDYRGLGITIALFGWMLCYFSVFTGPFAIWSGVQALRQLKQWNEQGGRLLPVLAILFGAAQTLWGLFMVGFMILGVVGLGAAGKP